MAELILSWIQEHKLCTLLIYIAGVFAVGYPFARLTLKGIRSYNYWLSSWWILFIPTVAVHLLVMRRGSFRTVGAGICKVHPNHSAKAWDIPWFWDDAIYVSLTMVFWPLAIFARMASLPLTAGILLVAGILFVLWNACLSFVSAVGKTL